MKPAMSPMMTRVMDGNFQARRIRDRVPADIEEFAVVGVRAIGDAGGIDDEEPRVVAARASGRGNGAREVGEVIDGRGGSRW